MKTHTPFPHARYALCAILALFFFLNLDAAAQVPSYPTEEIEPYFDLSFTKAERDSLYKNLQDYQKQYQTMHAYPLTNSTAMSLVFDPVPTGFTPPASQQKIDWGLPKDVPLPSNPGDLAFYPVHKLAVLLKARKITSTQLTTLYLARLKKYSDTLQCAIMLLEESALKQARKADEEIAHGKYRGPLHGIPYGIKDLLAVDGTRTTWGAAPFKNQEISETATVVRKLEEAGAVLVVKLTMGALAMGDIWYGGVTRNPWDLAQGSSGSSAGSASATSAGLVAFAIGTETLGSIVSPATRCGVTGLRPSYGRVSRHGAMALSWSMDKIGPICRSALDCAIVLDAIRGTDGHDAHVRNVPFNYAGKSDIRKLRVGYLKNHFDETYPTKENDEKSLEVLRSLGVVLVPVDLTTTLPLTSVRMMLSAEAAAAFDELTRSNRDSLLVNQRRNAWPNTFRAARFIPAVEYINASRVRTLLVNEFYSKTKDFDVIVAPSFGGSQLLLTNLTGTPCVVVPNGFNQKGSPTSISFLGNLYGEASAVLLAWAYQQATEWDEKTPPLFR
ncbi:MAG: amidase [Cytophagales bacterium]|nr:amidase [Cytophagales bacterium]